ncbi:MAG TPA: hypothetical protein VFW29_00425 [Solirubrobacteraceae bacterium]|nr:hypothetical protein [Solirubrobacteraceae bacterium]
MSDPGNVAKALRERLGSNTEDRLGKALSDLLESPLLTGAVGRAFDAREKATQAQEAALGALNLPSAADIERLTRRLRSVSHRLEGIEDGVDRLDRALSPSGVEARLSAIETQLRALTESVEKVLLTAARGGASRQEAARAGAAAPAAAAAPKAARSGAPRKPATSRAAASSAARTRAARTAAAKDAAARTRTAKPSGGARSGARGGARAEKPPAPRKRAP